MLINYRKIICFFWTRSALIYPIVLFCEPAASQKFIVFCKGLEIKSLSRIAPVVMGMDGKDTNNSKPAITVTNSMSPLTAIPRHKRVVLVLTGPIFGSMDSSEVKNSLICTRTGFKVTTAVTRGAEFNGTIRNNTLWQPQTEVIFEYFKPKIVVEATWKIVLDTGLEVSRDLHIPQQVFPTTIQKVIW
jgi:hypothetical protein